MGDFDPLNSVVRLDDKVSQMLDARAAPNRNEVVPAGSPELRAFSTYLHETIHWWQHISTTAGFVHALSTASQASATIAYLSQAGPAFPKPLTSVDLDSLSVNHPIRLAVARWTEIEYGVSSLSVPRRFNILLQQGAGSSFYESLGHTLLLFQISTVAALARSFDPGYAGLPDATRWIPFYDEFVRSQNTFFVPNQLIDLPLGMHHIMEGQARMSELQFRSLTVNSMSISEAMNLNWLVGDYGVAFEQFLRYAELTQPDDFDDPVVSMFLLLCDIALNPSSGYPEPINPRRDFVRDFHPGIRFLRLCQQIKRDKSLIKSVNRLSYDAYIKISQRLCERLDWLDPVAVGEKCLDAGQRMSGYQTLEEQAERCDFGIEDVPLRFYMSRHLEFLDLRTQCPHFYCWPGRYLAFTEKESDTAPYFNEMLTWSMPPFVTSSATSGVQATNIARGNEEARSKFTGHYFATQVCYDMIRQWISNPGDFAFKYNWKPELSESDLETLSAHFKKTVGFSHEKIGIATF
jgi:hypothetical protein